uniref:Craniofacial development protein 1 n=1 Tax=Anopheles atroparvus TaxID=41427 RepID=A0AAG5D525_ANOAO
MNQEEYPSDSDASDEDFRPDKEEGDTGSELDSDEDEIAENGEGTPGTKRKRKDNRAGAKKAKSSMNHSKESSDEKEEELDDEEEKRKTDALWASFLGGGSNPASETATSTKSNCSSGSSKSSSKVEVKANPKVTTVANSTPTSEKKEPTVAQLFEFAGEQVVLNGEGSKAGVDGGEKTAAGGIPAVPSIAKTSSSGFPRRVSGGGLGAVLNQINKKNKLTTLEKTKLDWTSFKRQEGIAEELQTHNKGKDGFLERRDFLERTDVRQFEIEKSFRQTKRSNR